MTPSQVLEEAKGRFVVLYHDSPEALERLLRQALGKFQDKAGSIAELWSDEPTFPFPEDYQHTASCCDSKRRYVPFREKREERTIALVPGVKTSAPYYLYYFRNLRDWPMDKELPSESVSLILDYLEALIAVPNTERQRNTYLWTNVNASQDLLSTQELKSRITELEGMMEDNKAIVPPASYF